MMKAEETAKRIVGAFSQDRKRSSADPWLTVSPIGTDAIEELIAEAIRQAEAGTIKRTEENCQEWAKTALAAARAEERFDCWEEAVGMTEILSFPELVKWIREQFEEVAKTQQ